MVLHLSTAFVDELSREDGVVFLGNAVFLIGLGLSFGELSNKARFIVLGCKNTFFCWVTDLGCLLSLLEMEGLLFSS